MTTNICRTQHGRDPRCLHRAELHEVIELKIRGKCTAEACGCSRFKPKKGGTFCCIHAEEDHQVVTIPGYGACQVEGCKCERFRRGKYGFEMRTFTPQDLLAMVKRARKRDVAALTVTLYLFGCRINEALSLRKEDVKVVGDKLVVNFTTLKKRGGSSLRKSAPMRKLMVPLTALQIKERRTGQQYDLILNPFLKHVGNLEDGELLFGLDYDSYWLKLKDLVPDRMISSHLFRHDRVSKLGEANVGPLKLQSFFGWADQRPLKSYLDLERIDLEEVGDAIK